MKFINIIGQTVNSSTKRHLLVGSTWTGKEKLPVSQEGIVLSLQIQKPQN